MTKKQVITRLQDLRYHFKEFNEDGDFSDWISTLSTSIKILAGYVPEPENSRIKCRKNVILELKRIGEFCRYMGERKIKNDVFLAEAEAIQNVLLCFTS